MRWKKRKRTEIESPRQRTRQSAKKQQVQKKEKEQVNKRKRDEKAKKEEQVKKKMVKLKGKKVEDDDEDFVVEEQHDEEDDNKNFELKFKSLRARTTVLPLYDATEYLSPERKSKIREMGFASMLDFPFQDTASYHILLLKNLNTEKMEVSLPTGSKIKITPKKIWEVLGIPMGKKKLESDSPRDFNDEFLTAFKKQFEFKKYPTTTDLSRLIQTTTNIDFMFQINYLMLFANYMINCNNTSRLKYHVIKNIKSSDIISDFDWFSFIWDHIRTSKIGWNDRTLQNCSFTCIILNVMFGLVDVIEENEETKNESEVEKQKLKELIYETIEAEFKRRKRSQRSNKKKEEAEKLAAENKKEAAEKSAKEAAKKTAKEAKEKAEKEAAEKAEREPPKKKKKKKKQQKKLKGKENRRLQRRINSCRKKKKRQKAETEAAE
ncbi:200 kDa antigen p200 [Tanacetum coccineum]